MAWECGECSSKKVTLLEAKRKKKNEYMKGGTLFRVYLIPTKCRACGADGEVHVTRRA